jgi:membrane protein
VGAGTKLRGLLGRKPAQKGAAVKGRPPTRTRRRAAAVVVPLAGAGPGRSADSPTEIPAQGWKQVLLRTKEQIKEDNVPLLAAGVAFYAFIALFPALIAAVTVYGLVADPAEVEEQIGSISDALPRRRRPCSPTS